MKLQVSTDEEWAETISSLWCDRLCDTPNLRLCLPTGDTPRSVYARLAASSADLSRAEVFLLDEFGLPNGHSARCDSMLQRDLIGLLDHDPAAFHTIDIMNPDPDAVAEQYGMLADERPFDLTILGLGSNGHLGLNEPGSGPDEQTRAVTLHQQTQARLDDYAKGALADWGITLGTRTLLASHELWLLVRGGQKASILHKTLHDEIGPDIPATYLRTHTNSTVFADESASALL